eukprot:scaffold77839_cov21-Tisochrysis_lutea.AAC.1
MSSNISVDTSMYPNKIQRCMRAACTLNTKVGKEKYAGIDTPSTIFKDDATKTWGWTLRSGAMLSAGCVKSEGALLCVSRTKGSPHSELLLSRHIDQVAKLECECTQHRTPCATDDGTCADIVQHAQQMTVMRFY